MSAGPAPGAEYRSGLDNEKGCNMGHGESGAVWSSIPCREMTGRYQNSPPIVHTLSRVNSSWWALTKVRQTWTAQCWIAHRGREDHGYRRNQLLPHDSSVVLIKLWRPLTPQFGGVMARGGGFPDFIKIWLTGPLTVSRPGNWNSIKYCSCRPERSVICTSDRKLSRVTSRLVNEPLRSFTVVGEGLRALVHKDHNPLP